MIHSSSSIQIRKVLRPDGELWPVLLQDGIPLILPNLWVEEVCTSSSTNTAEAYLRDVALIYRWASSKSISIGLCLQNLQGFNTPQLKAIAHELCHTQTGQEASKATCVRRFEAARSFMTFAFDYYMETRKVTLAEQAQAEKNRTKQLSTLRRHTRRHVNTAKAGTTSTDLNQYELAVLNQIIHPESLDNPFGSHRVRVRNYCLIQVAIAVLARKGEIVLLEVGDVDTSPRGSITIKVPDRNNRNKRSDGASLKTSGRCMPITPQLSSELRDYIDETRGLFLFPRTPSKALFLSTRDGRRLSTRTVNKILNTVAAHPKFSALGKRIHPHSLRTTGANELRSKIVRAGKTSAMKMTEAISYAGGWTQDSPQVSKYSRTSINEQLAKLLWKTSTDTMGHNFEDE